MQIEISPTSHACIGFGSNLGDRLATLRSARQALCTHPGVRCRAVSTLYESLPCGGPEGQGLYLNGALLIDTGLPPYELLLLLQQLEAKHGRLRRERWGERSLDLDLLLYGEQILDSPELTLPHPRMHERAFVLLPLAEIAPEEIHPLCQKSILQLSREVDISGLWPTTHGW